MKKTISAFLFLMPFCAFCFADSVYYEYYGYGPYYNYYYYDAYGYPWPQPTGVVYVVDFQKTPSPKDIDEMYTLQARKAAADAYDKILSLITIPDAEIYSSENNEIKAKITVNNNSGYTIKKIYFIGVITSKNTGGVIADETFGYVLPEPLLPMNKQTYEISMDKGFSVAHSDMCDFKAKVAAIDTADGQSIQGGAFSDEDKQELDKLRRGY
ncbi:MAG: hypothetical protein LBR69_06935 [Endomicrobium sp.]|jgi:hypothetical protein|nr:hypothetical protein [Endomicrobium sp.]